MNNVFTITTELKLNREYNAVGWKIQFLITLNCLNKIQTIKPFIELKIII